MRSLRSVVPALCIAAFGVAGCGLPRDQVLATLDRRDLEGAKRLHDDALGAPNGSLPTVEKQDTGLLLLDRAMIRAAQGDFPGASQDFAMADKIVDGDDIVRTKRMRNLKQPAGALYMYQRGWGQALNMPIGLKFYERLLVNPFAALSRLQSNDTRGACVEARRYGVIDEATDAIAPGRAARVRRFGELVSAVACDAGGDVALACSSWQRAGGMNDAVLEERCSHREGEAEARDLWVFVAYGRASHPLWSKTKDQDVVVIAGGAETDAANDLGITVDGKRVEVREDIDVEAAARADYTESKTAIEFNILGLKGRGGEWSPISWTLLPAHVSVARITVHEGHHDVRIRVRGQETQRVVEVGRERPGVAFAYVPW